MRDRSHETVVEIATLEVHAKSLGGTDESTERAEGQCGVEVHIIRMAKRKSLWWFGHVERIEAGSFD